MTLARACSLLFAGSVAWKYAQIKIMALQAMTYILGVNMFKLHSVATAYSWDNWLMLQNNQRKQIKYYCNLRVQVTEETRLNKIVPCYWYFSNSSFTITKKHQKNVITKVFGSPRVYFKLRHIGRLDSI